MQPTVYTKVMAEKSVETLRRQILLEKTNRAYGALRSNPELWGEELAERADWETTLADGLEEDLTASPLQDGAT
jgi:hypothetical protein